MYVWILEYDSNEIQDDKDWFDIVETKQQAIESMNEFIKNNNYSDKLTIRDDDFIVVYDTIQYSIKGRKVLVRTKEVAKYTNDSLN